MEEAFTGSSTTAKFMMISSNIMCNKIMIVWLFIDIPFLLIYTRPMLEVCLPSSLDPTLAPPGCHVMSIFSQYTPYHLSEGKWSDERRQQYADLVFDCIEKYAPGFKNLIVGTDILTPPDLERVFGLTGGNIFHGSMSLDQLYLVRPTPLNPSYSTAGIKGLYLCGSGAHPGRLIISNCCYCND